MKEWLRDLRSKIEEYIQQNSGLILSLIHDIGKIIYCFIVITIAPTIANKSIRDVKINHKG